MIYRPVKSLVKLFGDEVNEVRKLYRRDKPAALFLIFVLAIYAGLLVLSRIPMPSPPPTIASPTTDPNQAGYPATIRNPQDNSARIAIMDGEFQTLFAGSEMPVYSPRGGTTVRIQSCDWGDPPCKELAYAVFPGQRWEVAQENPYPRVILIRSK